MKRLWSLILVLLLIPCLVIAVSAAEDLGSCGDGLTCSFDAATGTLTISGSGPMEDFEWRSRPWDDYEDTLKTVSISDGVTSIGDRAFCGFEMLESINIPDSITVIGDSAFTYCYGLKEITLGSGVTEIGDDAFNDCMYLAKIVIPDSVRIIGDYAFKNSGVKSVSLGSGLTEIGEAAFQYCSKLTEIKIPDSVKTVGKSAFNYCEDLKTVTIGNGLTEISDTMFWDCRNITSVTLGTGVKSIGPLAFYRCMGLKEITFYGDAPTYFGHSAFGAITTTVYYPAGNTTWTAAVRQDYGGNITWKAVNLIPVVKVTGDSATGKPSITWTSVDDAVSYEIYGRLGKDGSYKKIGVAETTGYVHSAAKPGEKWYYRVRAVLSNGERSPYGKTVSFTNELQKPVVKISGDTASGKPKLSWNAVGGAAKYRIYRATSKTGAYSYLDSTTSTAFIDESAKAGTNYYYKVKAMNGDSASGYSNIVNRCCDLKKPVVTLKVDTASGKPKVTWEKISGAEKYYIVRATSKNGTYKKVATVSGTSYIDKETKAGKTYYYKVKALHEKDAADSAYSAVTSRVCDLKKPVVTISLKSGDPRIKWEAISGAEKYQVYRATSKDGEYKLVKTTKTATSFTDTDVKAGKTYYYKVMAIHETEAANSAYSTVKYIKAK